MTAPHTERTESAEREPSVYSACCAENSIVASRPTRLVRDSSPRRRFAATGFTLIELLVVIAIIGVLAGLTLGVAHYAREKAKRSRASAEIAAMENALEGFKNDNGYYPQGNGLADSSTNIYSSVVVGPKTYMTFRVNQLRPATSGTGTNIVDPFGIPYFYRSPGETNTVSFDLWSGGPDKTPNTADDITNWKQN
jgi:general secretion pathway protein G